MGRDIKFERNAGIEVEAVEDAAERLLARRQSKTVVADRAGKDERNAAGAVAEFTQRNFVAKRRIRVIDPRQNLPRCRTRPRRNRPCVGAALRQRVDGKAVIGGADQALKRHALEHRIDELAPLLACSGRKIGGEQ